MAYEQKGHLVVAGGEVFIEPTGIRVVGPVLRSVEAGFTTADQDHLIKLGDGKAVRLEQYDRYIPPNATIRADMAPDRIFPWGEDIPAGEVAVDMGPLTWDGGNERWVSVPTGLIPIATGQEASDALDAVVGLMIAEQREQRITRALEMVIAELEAIGRRPSASQLANAEPVIATRLENAGLIPPLPA